MKNAINPLAFLILLFLLFTTVAMPQSLLSRQEINRTLLQVSSGFYTVEKNATVDLDSSLLVTSRWHKLSRVPVITEGIDDSYTSKNCQWMDANNPESAKRQLAKLTGTEHARLSLLIGAYYSFHPAFDTKYIDSGIFYLTLAKKECDRLSLANWSLQCSCLLGKCYFKRNDVSNGIKWSKMITDHEAQISDKQILAKVYNYQGMYCPFLANTTIFRIDCLKKALGLYEMLKDTSNQINTLMNIAYMSVANRDLKGAESSALRSLFLQKATHFPYTQFTTDLLAYFSDIKSDYSKELAYAFDAVKSIEANKDSLVLGHFYGRIATSYDYLEDQTESILWRRKSLVAFEQNGGDSEIFACLRDIEYATQNPAESRHILKLTENAIRESPPNNASDKQFIYMTQAHAYENLKEFELARKYYINAENIEKSTPLLNGGMVNFRLADAMARFYLKTKNYELSKSYFLKLLAEPYKSITPKETQMHAYFELHLIDSVMGNYPSSLSYFNKYASLNDTIYSKNQTKQIATLDITYKTKQREKDLQLLRAQNQLNLQRESTTRKLTIGGFIVLLFVIFMIYNRYYYNKKSNGRLLAQKEEIDSQNHALQILNGKQRALLTEKEWLLKEIHHRVKNNLQTTISLLKMQSAYIDNDSALEVMANSQHRMFAMALIHQKLYQSDEMTNINIKDYIFELVNYLKESYGEKSKTYSRNKINFEMDIAPLNLDVAQAIPLGLIINEAVTNAIKYAFPENSKGVVTIYLKQHDDDHFLLKISDNGIGLPNSFDLNATNSLGMNLMRGLCDQLQGEFHLDRNNGTSLNFTFIRSENVVTEGITA